MEIVPTGFPELFKPTRDLLELRKTELFRIKKNYTGIDPQTERTII